MVFLEVCQCSKIHRFIKEIADNRKTVPYISMRACYVLLQFLHAQD